jgi:predicted DNA-binding protein YlxM (UPF0122 family)
MATTKTRKKQKGTVRLSDQDRFNVVQRYMTSADSAREIAKDFNTTEKNVELIIQRHWKSLTNVRETKLMSQNQGSQLDHKDSCYYALKSIGKVPQINEDFLQLLSGPEEHLLTDHELQYCYNLVATGDSLKALESAGLNKGLLTAGSDKTRNQYKLACQLRGHYLRQKKNVAQYLTKLKEEQYIPEAIDKQFVQRELLEVLHHQKEGGEPAEKKLRTIELLGKSVGAFSDVIKVEEIDPAKALDYIDSLAQADASASKDVIEFDE